MKSYCKCFELLLEPFRLEIRSRRQRVVVGLDEEGHLLHSWRLDDALELAHCLVYLLVAAQVHLRHNDEDRNTQRQCQPKVLSRGAN